MASPPIKTLAVAGFFKRTVGTWATVLPLTAARVIPTAARIARYSQKRDTSG
jgi:hypothetical protein